MIDFRRIKLYGILVWLAPSLLYASDAQTMKKLETFAKVLGYVEANYPQEVQSEQLIDDAIKGLLSRLDPHTLYMPADVFREMQVDTKGEFGGLGIEISVRDGILTIVAPIEDTPASRKGIRPGDQIIKINETITQDMTLIDAVKHLRGPIGSSVKLTLKRESQEELIEVSLTREVIVLKSVRSDLLDENYGYIRITNFQERTSKDLKKSLDQLDRSANQKLRGLILDLRNNPGGLLDQAIEVADLFLDSGTIVSTIGKRAAFQEVKSAHKKGTRPFLPMMVLINEGTASAGEIVAGALQDHKRAILLGASTFGKGSVQTIIDLGDGAGLKLTIAQYYTPSGRSIQALGITPDIQVSPEVPQTQSLRSLRESDLEGHLENPQSLPQRGNVKGKKSKRNGTELDLKGDIQLRRALEHLKTLDLFRDRVVPKA